MTNPMHYDLLVVAVMWGLLFIRMIYVFTRPTMTKEERWHEDWNEKLRVQGRWDGDTGRHTTVIRQLPMKYE